jgi:excinuclease ABC subunit B
MYGDKITGSMERAISETNRRRQLQHEYNIKNNITPRSIVKGVRKIIEATLVAEDQPAYEGKLGREEIEAIISGLEAAMLKAAEALEFEKAADIRDKIIELRKSIRD